MNEILDNLTPLFEGMDDGIRSFKRDVYSDVFQSYREENYAFFAEVNRMLEAKEEGFADEFAQHVVDYVADTLGKLPGKGKREKAQLDYNMFVAVYFIPALLEGKQDGVKELAERICEKWAAAFKGNNIKVADFASIDSGFRTKLCYITTAVCRSLNKPDDCYELELLRGYRDNYLLKTEGGELLVEKYYDVAPTIVKRIDKSADAQEKYQYIWEHYLKPCIAAIETGAMEECANTYEEMVEELCGEYMTTAKEKDKKTS